MSDMKAMVDHLMRRLYLGAKGELYQVLIADYSIADIYRNSLSPEYAVSNRAIVQATRASWRMLSFLFGSNLGFRLCSYAWTVLGIPTLLLRCLQLSEDAYARTGPLDAKVLLLCTGVANEEKIAAWLDKKHPTRGVSSLLIRSSPTARLRSIKYLPEMFLAHMELCRSATTALVAMNHKKTTPRKQQHA